MGRTLTCAFSQWSPGLGDNTFMGWLTVFVYALAGVATVAAARAMAADPLSRRERLFWGGAAAVMLFLAVNKQLDLQTLLTMIGRCHAQLAGWYDDRRAVQKLFILAVAGGGVLSLGVLALVLRGILGRVWAALLGLGFVCVFVVIRAASFHHVDLLISGTALGVRINWLLELPGPLLVILVALRRRRAVRAD
ncbi:isopropylmalate isomerase [Tabrizicola sp.]|uniref:isopropylmalate isomerase n=1 Tax=Tabrizicola sp. TaxID=2005166 RepID=UPI002FDE05C0